MVLGTYLLFGVLGHLGIQMSHTPGIKQLDEAVSGHEPPPRFGFPDIHRL